MKITKKSMANMEKQEDNKKTEEVIKEKNIETSRNDLKERVKVPQNSDGNKPRAVWKNGNVVIIKEDNEQLENDK